MSSTNLEQFLDHAIAAAQALVELHDGGRIHYNLCPANLQVDADGAVTLLNASPGELARIVSTLRPHRKLNPDALPYISPEQTGRMNRPLDQRSDLYSLGVTLYQRLTGALPFHAEDTLGWMHCHIARPPRPPIEVRPDTPRVVSDILLKLLGKMAEDRYQTARGLQSDLARCRAQLRATGQIEPFPLGSQDLWGELRISTRLYGREEEAATLLAVLERVVATGAPELVMVGGYSGIGKSFLVQEMHRPLVRERGYFLSGKFDQLSRDIPYSTIGRAFRDLIQHILTEGEAELDLWRPRLREALGSSAQLVVDVIPQLELVIGPQPPVATLPLNDAQSRFMAVFQRFIAVFARREHPIVLFLDDLQWADMATLDLLKTILVHAETRHILVIGAYRDNEVGRSHPLVATLAGVRQDGGHITLLSLGPLSSEHLAQLVADSLHCTPARAEPLARLLAEKTAGNPFFVTQFLTDLTSERLLRFNAKAGTWQWDLAEIEAKKYTDNVVELLVGRLKRLAPATQTVLTLAACIGNEVESALLVATLDRTEEQVQLDLAPAIQDGLILPHGGSYNFLHDRVQQAAYSLIPEEQLGTLHLRIGRLLQTRSRGPDGDEQLFDRVHHLNRGASLIVDPDERRLVAEQNLLAGRKAKASAAYVSAANYLSTGLTLIPASSWDTEYALTLALHIERAECEFASGNFAETERLCAIIIARGASNVDKTLGYVLRIKIHLAGMDNKQSLALGMECLALFGVEMPANPGEAEAAAALAAIRERLNRLKIEDLLELPPMVNREVKAVMEVLTSLLSSTYYTNTSLLAVMMCLLVNLSMEHGNGPDSPLAYATLGSIFCSALAEYRDGYRLGKLAFDLVERHGPLAAKAEVCNIVGCMVAPWSHHLDLSVDLCRIGLRAAQESGNISFTCFQHLQLTLALLGRGAPLDQVVAAAEATEEYSRSTKHMYVIDGVTGMHRFAQAMLGLTLSLSSFDSDGFRQAEFEEKTLQTALPVVQCFYYIELLKARVIAGDVPGALAAAAAVKPVLWSVSTMYLAFEYHFYAGLAAAAALADAPEPTRAALREALAAHMEKTRVWAASCPDNFHGKHMLLCAELARVEGQDDDAVRHYYQAIQSCRANGFVHDEGLCAELAARFHGDRGLEPVAAGFLRSALACYAAWGAHGKIRDLEWRHADLLALAQPEVARGRGPRAEDLDAQVAIAASQALSGELELDRLLTTLLRLVLEHAGAERCCLLLLRGGGTVAAAEGRVGPTGIKLRLGAAGSSPAAPSLPTSIVNYVKRTREPVLLTDAVTHAVFGADEYIAGARPRSLLCMPIMRNAALVAILYLENNLVAGAFAPRSLALLDLLASQTAISLENATLYADLSRAESRLRRLIETANVLPWEVDTASERFTYAGPQSASILGYPAHVWTDAPVREFLRTRVHPEDLAEAAAQFLSPAGRRDGHVLEFRMFAADGRVVWLQNVVRAAPSELEASAASGFLFDISARKQVEAALKDRLDIIERQQSTIQELSTPIIEVWDGVLTMPLLGTIDNLRAERMMDVLLEAVVRTGHRHVIVDLTGVVGVDTNTAAHIVRLIRAVELLGARGLIVGIRPALASVIVSAGIDLSAIPTPANLREALLMCMSGRLTAHRRAPARGGR